MALFLKENQLLYKHRRDDCLLVCGQKINKRDQDKVPVNNKYNVIQINITHL